MNIQTTQQQINVCPKFWRDVKDLQKIYKRREFFSNVDPETFQGLDDEFKVKSVSYISAISNYILNTLPNSLDNISDKYDRQPFLQYSWTIRKMRYALDNRGKSHGARIIFCVNNFNIVFVCIFPKNRCTDERDLESEFMERISTYLVN